MTKFSFTHLVIEMTVNNRCRKHSFLPYTTTLLPSITPVDPAITPAIHTDRKPRKRRPRKKGVYRPVVRAGLIY